MNYYGVILCENIETSGFLQLFSDPSTLHSRIQFQICTFEAFHVESIPDIHIAVVEIPSPRSGPVWFQKISGLLARYPFLRILPVLNGDLSNDFYYLNRIPYTYLLPLDQAEFLLPTGLDKAIHELDTYRLTKNLKRSDLNESYLSAVLFSTDELHGKGHKGCYVYFPDGEKEYLRISLKTMLSKLPGNFQRVHKSFILNMEYYGRQILSRRPHGKELDEYILLSGTTFDDNFKVPVGPKYKNDILDFLMNKYAYPALDRFDGKEADMDEN